MGSKYPVLSPEEIISVLKKAGFKFISQRGSHVKYSKEGSPTRIAIIPMHNEVAKGTLKSIIEQAGMTLEDLLELLK